MAVMYCRFLLFTHMYIKGLSIDLVYKTLLIGVGVP